MEQVNYLTRLNSITSVSKCHYGIILCTIQVTLNWLIGSETIFKSPQRAKKSGDYEI